MNEVLKTIRDRRSTRGFSDVQLTEEQLQAMIDAAVESPTARNTQMWHFSFVQNKAVLDELRVCMAQQIGKPEYDVFYGAPTVLVVLADKAIRTCVEDASLVIGNLMNAAFSVGVDSCWIHRAKEEFESDEGKALLASWGIDGDYVGVGHLILGYRDGELPVTRPRKETYIYRV